MKKFITPSRQCCPAMMEAEIYDPESRAGIDFCINYCPYECCIIFETVSENTKGKRKARIARSLSEHGVSVDDIALILKVGYGSVMRYLK